MKLIQKKLKTLNGFTVIELIVIMAVMAILVFLGVMGYQGYTKQAKMTKLAYDARLLSDACQRFYVDTGDYPRKSDDPYTLSQVNDFSMKVYNLQGKVIVLDSSGSYYDLDLSKLSRYVKLDENYLNFILQNPVGDVYILDPSTNVRLPENVHKIPGDPTISVNTSTNPPKISVSYPILFPDETQYKLDDGNITTEAPSGVLAEGPHTVSVRYKNSGFYSNWVSADFVYAKPAAPTVTVSIATNPPTYTIAYPNGITPQLTEYQLDNGLVTTSAPTDLLADGNHNIKIRYQYNSLYSEWSSNDFAIASGVKQVVGADTSSYALMSDGTVKVWGENYYGQLGISTNSGTYTKVTVATTIPDLNGVKQIAAGQFSVLALMNDGTVKSWGYDSYGQLGVPATSGTYGPHPTPTTISGLSGVKQVAEGTDISFAVLNDGTVKSWGLNNYGQLGRTKDITPAPHPTPTIISGLSGVSQISAGNYHVLALLNDGTVKAWGSNSYGQLGTYANLSGSNSVPTLIAGLSNVIQVSNANGDSSFAVLSDGTMKSWGLNNYGQLGNSTNAGTYNANPNPLSVSLSNIKQISTGTYHTVALLNNGTVYSFGWNYFGELGISKYYNNSTSYVWSPTVIPNLTGVKSISAGAGHNLFIVTGNAVNACGNNQNGQTGAKTGMDYNLNVVSGL